MRPSAERMRRGLVLACLLLTVGCVSQQELDEKNQQLAAARRNSTEQAAELAKAQQAAARANEELHELTEASTRLEAELAAVQEELSAKVAALSSAESEKVDMVTRLTRAEQAVARERSKVKKAVSAATEQVEELTRLRAQARELTQSDESLRATASALRAEKEKLDKELETAQSELLAANAVIRSISQGGSEGQDAQAAVLQDKIAVLEKKNRGLEQELDQLRAVAKGSVPAELLGSVSDSADGSSEAKAAGVGFVGLLQERLQGMVAGESQWDGTDVTVVCAVGAFFLILVWLVLWPLRATRRKRQKAMLNDLQTRLAQAERRADGSEDERGGRVVGRRSASARARGVVLSPIVDVDEDEVEEEDVEEDEYDEAMDEVTVQLGAFDPSDAAEPEALASEHAEGEAWDGEAEAEGEYEEDDEDEDEEDDEFANTQIIPSLNELDGLGELENPSKKSPQGKSADQPKDRDFMNELKEMIGQKVDEMIQ